MRLSEALAVAPLIEIRVSGARGSVGPKGDPGSPGAGYATRAALKAAAAAAVDGDDFELTELGREGWFIFRLGNYTVHTALDLEEGVFMQADGIPVATGALVRQFTGRPDIRWFGGLANSTALVGGVWNGAANDNAFLSAKGVAAILRAGGVYFPAGPGLYRMTSKRTFTGQIGIVGDGWTENPGVVNGVSYPLPTNYAGSIICFDTDVACLEFLPYTDNNADATAFEYQSANGSFLRDIMFYGGGGVGTDAHAALLRTRVDMDNVRFENFAGYGLRIIGNDGGAVPYGSVDCGSFRRVSIRQCRLAGVKADGMDINVNEFSTIDVALCGGVAYFFPTGLGNGFASLHAATCNQSHPANTYAANHSAAQRAQNLADCPDLADRFFGSYLITGGVAANALTACYTEPGEGQKGRIEKPSAVLAGNLASPASIAAGSTAFRLNGTQLYNVGEIFGDDSSVVKVYNSVTCTRLAGDTNLQYLRNVGLGSYAIFQLYGAGGIANGLDIITGLGITYVATDTVVFRNAAQTSEYGEIGAAGCDLRAGKVYKIAGTQVLGPRQAGTPAAATDPATTMALANFLRTAGLASGWIG